MKLLFDQNLSPRLVDLLADLFPESSHLQALGLDSADDAVIWDHAEQSSFIIVSKDSDFVDYSAAFGFPPHVLQIQLGNCTTAEIAELIRKNALAIEAMVAGGELGMLELR